MTKLGISQIDKETRIDIHAAVDDHLAADRPINKKKRSRNKGNPIKNQKYKSKQNLAEDTHLQENAVQP